MESEVAVEEIGGLSKSTLTFGSFSWQYVSVSIEVTSL